MTFKIIDSRTAHKVGTGEFHSTETSAEYLAWLAAGNTPDPPPTPNPNDLILAQIAAIKAQLFNSTTVLEAAATNGSNAAKTEVAARVAEIEALRAQLV